MQYLSRERYVHISYDAGLLFVTFDRVFAEPPYR